MALRPRARPSLALRPSLSALRRTDQGRFLPASQAWESTSTSTSTSTSKTATTPAIKTEDKESGHIAVESNESILFFDSELAPGHEPL